MFPPLPQSGSQLEFSLQIVDNLRYSVCKYEAGRMRARLIYQSLMLGLFHFQPATLLYPCVPLVLTDVQEYTPCLQNRVEIPCRGYSRTLIFLSPVAADPYRKPPGRQKQKSDRCL